MLVHFEDMLTTATIKSLPALHTTSKTTTCAYDVTLVESSD